MDTNKITEYCGNAGIDDRGFELWLHSQLQTHERFSKWFDKVVKTNEVLPDRDNYTLEIDDENTDHVEGHLRCYLLDEETEECDRILASDISLLSAEQIDIVIAMMAFMKNMGEEDRKERGESMTQRHFDQIYEGRLRQLAIIFPCCGTSMSLDTLMAHSYENK